VMNLALTHRDYGAHARLVRRVVVHANLAEGGHGAHLGFRRSQSLNTCVTLIRPVTRSSTPVTISAATWAPTRSARTFVPFGLLLRIKFRFTIITPPHL
jgi:hypothetical protein